MPYLEREAKSERLEEAVLDRLKRDINLKSGILGKIILDQIWNLWVFLDHFPRNVQCSTELCKWLVRVMRRRLSRLTAHIDREPAGLVWACVESSFSVKPPPATRGSQELQIFPLSSPQCPLLVRNQVVAEAFVSLPPQFGEGQG